MVVNIFLILSYVLVKIQSKDKTQSSSPHVTESPATDPIDYLGYSLPLRYLT
jgi:hypothetical protein